MIKGIGVQDARLRFEGTLETVGAEAVAVGFVALIHEEGGRGGGPWLAQSMYGSLRKQVGDVIGRVVRIETRHGVTQTLKEADFGLTPAVIAWCGGAGIGELAERTDASPGDVCRTLRMAIQLMREVRRAIDPDWDIFERLGAAIELVNRDEVDARRQSELRLDRFLDAPHRCRAAEAP